MKKIENKRWMVIIPTVMVMILMTAGFAISGFKNQFGPFGGHGMKKERILSKVDYTVQELKLTPAQQGKYSVIREKMVRDMDKLMERRDAVKSNMKSEMSKANPDVKAMAVILKSEIRTMPDMLTAQIDSLMEVYDILDASQQKKLVSMIKERMAKRDKFGSKFRD